MYLFLHKIKLTIKSISNRPCLMHFDVQNKLSTNRRILLIFVIFPPHPHTLTYRRPFAQSFPKPINFNYLLSVVFPSDLRCILVPLPLGNAVLTGDHQRKEHIHESTYFSVRHFIFHVLGAITALEKNIIKVFIRYSI